MRNSPTRWILLTCLAVVLTGLGWALLKMPGVMTAAHAQSETDPRIASARAVLEQAQAIERANPTEENAAAVDAALAQYNLAVATRVAEIQVRLMELAALNTGGQTKDAGIEGDASSSPLMDEYKALQDELVSLGGGAEECEEAQENFDGVTAPALPAGWTATTAIDCANSNPWATSTSGTPAPAFDTTPNAAFVNDPNCISDERLDSPSFAITSPSAQLTFRNNFNMETGFDGGVLEISIGGGAFTDILTAGGTFATGGYNGTISVNFGSPIAGRMAWTGNSAGFITTTVNLPASANGQSIVLRWRRGTDSSVSGQGWRIDTMSISGLNCTVTECEEKFDNVTAPALPTGWMATTAIDCANSNPWATSTSGTPAPAFDTSPNAAFVNDPNCISDERLDSPSFPIVSPSAQLTFRNNFNMETGFDGGVLEIKIGAGAFQDILTAGGSFVTGGYNGTISVNFGSPIAGRMAWTGNSAGFITTTVNLPASANGQSIVLRWRRGTDSSVSGQGWRIDTMSISGSDCAACLEQFDGVTAPALPANWSAITAIDCANSNPWATSTSGTPAPAFDTSPNAAFVNDPNCISDERLESPSFPIISTSAQLTFRNNFNMETGFDGGVLEIKIGAGAFQDILTAGGTFATGGYSGTISVNFGSPIGGRMAWTGNSAGFITTTVNLPASANGQNIVLRWRRATDSSVSGQGWRIDTIAITDAVCDGDECMITCPSNITVSNDPNQCGAVVNYPAPTTTGNCGTVTCSPASGSFFPVGTTTVTCTTTAGPSCSFTVTVNQDTPATTTITAGPATIVTESCPPANGQIDVGERVTVHLELQNTGACPTNDLVATLVQGGGVTSPSDPQSYGALAPGSSDGRDFTFTAIGSCGGTLTATWNLNDGPNNLGTVTKTFTLACIAPSCGMVRLVVLVDSLTRTNATTVKATYRVRNTGTLLADDVTLTNAKLGSTTGGPLPTFIGDIPPDTSSPPFDVFFTNSTPGASSTLTLGGTYTGGTFTSTRRVTIP